jgi:predicted ATPase
MLLKGFSISAHRAMACRSALPFLAAGDINVVLDRPLTFLVGENGSGKTSILEAIADRLRMRVGGGRSLLQTEEDDAGAALADALQVDHGGGRPPDGWFMRADGLHEALASAGRIQGMDGRWKPAGEQSRGEGMLSLIAGTMEASERRLYLLDEPETGLSPERQLGLLVVLDDIARDGRSQALVATHSPMLMSHPDAAILWIDEDGIQRRELDDVPHWTAMQRFMKNPGLHLRHLLQRH